MKQIIITEVVREHHKFLISFQASDGVKRYFNEFHFFLEYSIPLNEIPSSIAVIPLVCNILPVIWLTDSELIVPELDRDFLASIPKFKMGYIDMYPQSQFRGKIVATKIVDNSYIPREKCLSLFSGGLDAIHTLFNNLSNNPDLITILGADVSLDNPKEIEAVTCATKQFGDSYGLKNVVIKSNFVTFLNHGRLNRSFQEELGGNWWHHIQHGIGLISLTAPYAYDIKAHTIFIASSFYRQYPGRICCASDFNIDSHVKIASCSVNHYGYECSRQDKIQYVVNHTKDFGRVNLRVCWTSSDGYNCCHCEKCYRTILGIIAEGKDPRNFGFNINETTLRKAQDYLLFEYEYENDSCYKYEDIKKHYKRNKKLIRASHPEFYKQTKWITSCDFKTPRKSFAFWHRRIRRRINIICGIQPI